MHLKKLGVRNFRRLKDVLIDLASDISIFVGANNSGKTSVGHALQLFTGKNRFTVHEFNADLWPQIVDFGDGNADASLPSLELDLWLEVGAEDIHRVIDLLPRLAWKGAVVGMRVSFEAIDPGATRNRYLDIRQRALEAVAAQKKEGLEFDPSPKNLLDYLREKLNDEYELRYYVLDPSRFDQNMVPEPNYSPGLFVSRERNGRETLNSLLKIDFLDAQRHLSDSSSGARAEDLSRVLSRFYSRNLEQQGDDIEALLALANSEASLNDHLERVFKPTLKNLSKLGYPGLSNPRLMIRSALDPVQMMGSRDGTRLHYALGPDDGDPNPPSLPDRYNLLGFKNLIFMVVQLLDLHAQWLGTEDSRPPVHLIFIEEPEAHLHAQLQQAFIRKVMALLALDELDRTKYTSQLVVTTHSTHILYERGFQPIRYFRRNRTEHVSTSEVLNLSIFYNDTDSDVRTFLERYLKLTHCDLFFADAAVLVEGNVERLLLPQMIASAAPRLQSCYLTILEIGGAFGYRFKALIEFLGLTTLIITDLDSVFGPLSGAAEAQPEVGNQAVTGTDTGIVEEDVDEYDEVTGQEKSEKPGKACIAGHVGAVTSNQTLLQWLPRLVTVEELWRATDGHKTQARANANDALVRVAYQCQIDVAWNSEVMQLSGRTLEEAFALENLVWCQDIARQLLQLRIAKSDKMNLKTLAERIHKRVQASSFKKTDFALELLAQEPESWTVPTYIAQGLIWLEEMVAPPETDEDTGEAEATQQNQEPAQRIDLQGMSL